MRLTLRRALMITGMASSLLGSSMASAFTLDGTVWALAQDKGVDPYLLYSIALAESKKVSGKMVRPWPWAVNIAGKGYYFDSLKEAEKFVDDKLAAGIQNMDIGPLQVNLRWNGFRVTDPKQLFHLPTAVRVGADILSEALASSPNDQVLAVGRYHTWSDDLRARQYGTKVLMYRKVMVEAGR